MANIQLKRDPYLAGFAAVLVVAAGYAVHADWLTAKEALAFLAATFVLPGFFGSKPASDVSETTTTDPPPPANDNDHG